MTNENKKRRYPSDRLKLHALLAKKEQESAALQAEVRHLQALVKQADVDAIVATADMYHVTPEELSAFMQKFFGDRAEPVPEAPEAVTAEPAVPDELLIPEEEPIDDEET